MLEVHILIGLMLQIFGTFLIFFFVAFLEMALEVVSGLRQDCLQAITRVSAIMVKLADKGPSLKS